MPKGFLPVPPDIDMKDPSPFVRVSYHASYSCSLCGWEHYTSRGCIPALIKHLQEKHNIKDAQKLFIAAYGQMDIIDALDAFEKEKTHVCSCRRHS